LRINSTSRLFNSTKPDQQQLSVGLFCQNKRETRHGLSIFARTFLPATFFVVLKRALIALIEQSIFDRRQQMLWWH
jgi:hypothetical protein